MEKCGGTSVETALQPYLDWGDIIIGSTSYGEQTQEFLFNRYGARKAKNDLIWKHSTARQAYRYIGKDKWKDYKKIVVVRDPVDLAKSLYSFSEKILSYHSKIDYGYWAQLASTGDFSEDWPYGERYIRSFITTSIRGGGFNAFVKDMVKNDYDCFSPFVERIRPTFFDKDFGTVIDLSQLNNRWEEITESIGIKGSVLQTLNGSGSNDLNIKQNSIEEIKKRFAIDYEILPLYTGVNW